MSAIGKVSSRPSKRDKVISANVAMTERLIDKNWWKNSSILVGMERPRTSPSLKIEVARKPAPVREEIINHLVLRWTKADRIYHEAQRQIQAQQWLAPLNFFESSTSRCRHCNLGNAIYVQTYSNSGSGHLEQSRLPFRIPDREPRRLDPFPKSCQPPATPF